MSDICSDSEEPFEHWWMVTVADFDRLLNNPPDTSRAALKWDESLITKELIMYWNKPGFQCWYHGSITAYNSDTQKHTIEWLEDDDPPSVVDLLACKMCFEWRLVQDDEEISVALTNLRAQ